MMDNREIIHKFYTAFANGDGITMATFYHPKATFTDPVFGQLTSHEVKMMWQMLTSRSKNNLNVEHEIISHEKTTVTVKWVATYTFGKSKRKVVNRVSSYFVLADGLIVQQTDSFNLYAWAKQALGFNGFLLGWSHFFKNQMQKKSKTMLNKYMLAKG